jgi:hypothetical protein
MRRNFTIDNSLKLRDAGAATASARAQVSSADKIVDLGAGFVKGNILLDVTALALDGNDESYDIVVQLSPDADFGTAGSIKERISLNLSAKEVKRTDCDADDVVGRYILPFDNEFAGTVYRYLSLYTVHAGVTSSINYTAWMVKDD